jgi:membrane protease YdiL (CAAX protease family)
MYRFSWRLGLSLIIALGVPRFLLVLQANETGNYQFVPIVFLMMMVLPFLFLSKHQRRAIGLKRPSSLTTLFLTFALGATSCFAAFLLAESLYGMSIGNCFVYISNSYPVSQVGKVDKFLLFVIVAIPSIIFSPIGEEFFYRGWVHQCFIASFGETRASYIDSAAFALTHVAHFGIVFNNRVWSFLPVPAVLWVVWMFLISRLFFYCKQRTDSLWGAVACHAGFNLAMTYVIVYFVL